MFVCEYFQATESQQNIITYDIDRPESLASREALGNIVKQPSHANAAPCMANSKVNSIARIVDIFAS